MRAGISDLRRVIGGHRRGRPRGGYEDRTPTHGYEATREAAMAAFAKSWRRE